MQFTKQRSRGTIELRAGPADTTAQSPYTHMLMQAPRRHPKPLGHMPTKGLLAPHHTTNIRRPDGPFVQTYSPRIAFSTMMARRKKTVCLSSP